MPGPQNILALDTALGGCCVGVCRKDVSFSKTEPMVCGQAERLVPLINEILAESGLAFDELDALVTTLGPGAFAGLRIGISTAKALGMALDIPVYGITNFQALLLNYTLQNIPDENIAVVLETKRRDFYIQSFSKTGEAITKPQALSVDHIKIEGPHAFIGDALARFQRETGAEGEYIDGFELSDMAVIAQALRNDTGVFTETIQPLYLRGADVSTPKAPLRVLEEKVQ